MSTSFNSMSGFGQKSPSQTSSNVDSSKKLQHEMEELAHKVKHHEYNIKQLKALDNKLEAEILDGHIEIGEKFTTARVENKDAYPEEVIISNILKYEKYTAAFFYRMKTDMSDHSLTKDVIGVVATLATTEDARLSSMLSEYLGQETMLSIVCKTSEGAKALEAYNQDGSSDENSGVHGHFQVICLDDLRPYPGRFIYNDSHKRLDLVKPILQGETPTGFLGFAVNMISIDRSNMYCMSKVGNTLRETLFYNLFSSLQVYESTEGMLKAQPFISNGAVSLDGRVIRRNGDFFEGRQMKDVDVKFPTQPGDSIHSVDYYENMKRMKGTNWKKIRNLEDSQREQDLLDRAKYIYGLKKKEFVNFLANDSQVGRTSTPR